MKPFCRKPSSTELASRAFHIAVQRGFVDGRAQRKPRKTKGRLASSGYRYGFTMAAARFGSKTPCACPKRRTKGRRS